MNKGERASLFFKPGTEKILSDVKKELKKAKYKNNGYRFIDFARDAFVNWLEKLKEVK